MPSNSPLHTSLSPTANCLHTEVPPLSLGLFHIVFTLLLLQLNRDIPPRNFRALLRDILPQMDALKWLNTLHIYTHEGSTSHLKWHLSSRPTWQLINYVNFKNSSLSKDNSDLDDCWCIGIIFPSTIILIHHMPWIHHGFAPKTRWVWKPHTWVPSPQAALVAFCPPNPEP